MLITDTVWLDCDCILFYLASLLCFSRKYFHISNFKSQNILRKTNYDAFIKGNTIPLKPTWVSLTWRAVHTVWLNKEQVAE